MKTSIKAILLLVVLASGTVTRATPEFEGVLAGTDWFVHLPGTFVTFNGGTVSMTGNPLFVGGPDAIIRRLSDLNVPDVANSSATTATIMTLLALKSVAPVNIGGSFFDIYVDLDPGKVTTGSLTLTQTVTGEGATEGTISSFFDVFFDISWTPTGQPKAPCTIGVNCLAGEVNPLDGSGSWTDDLANGTYASSQVNYVAPTMAQNMQQIATPEPASLLLFGTGLLGIVGAARRKWIG